MLIKKLITSITRLIVKDDENIYWKFYNQITKSDPIV